MSFPWVEMKEPAVIPVEWREDPASEVKRDVRAETLIQKNWFRSSATSLSLDSVGSEGKLEEPIRLPTRR